MIFELYLGDLIETEKEVLRGEGGELAREGLTLKQLRAQRWATRANDFLSIHPDLEAQDIRKSELASRYLWANVILATFSGRSREFIMCCFKELEVILHDAAMIQLPNRYYAWVTTAVASSLTLFIVSLCRRFPLVKQKGKYRS